MVISGINLGANMGDDTIYSGTVAAATEGFLLGIPSIAMSLASKEGEAFRDRRRGRRRPRAPPRRRAGRRLAPQRQRSRHRAARVRGTEVTRLGRRHKAEDVIKMKNPRGETVYWVGGAGPAADAGAGTDFHAVEHDFVSVTPLQIDLTHRDRMDEVAGWLKR
jgi:5'-nucleotidase